MARELEAKTALCRMETIRRTFNSLSSSLDGAIKDISASISHEIGAVGFTSLPDESIARIFELYHEEYDADEDGFGYEWSLDALAAICSRFRHIALRLPALWEDVSPHFDEARILRLKSRCSNPVIHFRVSDIETQFDLSKFLEMLHPNAYWRGLRLIYDSPNDLHEVVQLVDSVVTSPFEDLRSLSIHGCEDSHDSETFQSEMRRQTSPTLATWGMPRLTSLSLQNVIPLNKLHIPNLKTCDISCNNVSPNNSCTPYTLDMKTLKQFLADAPNMVELSITFSFVELLGGFVSDHPAKLFDPSS